MLSSCAPTHTDKSSFRCSGSWFLPPSFHGNVFSQGGDGTHIPFIFEQPFLYIPASKVFEPQLALEAQTAPDGLSQTWKLRSNVTWHDGQPFTSEDVRSTFLLYWLQGWGGRLKAIETPDPYTVIFQWRKPLNFREAQEVKVRRIQAPAHIYSKYAQKAQRLLQQASTLPVSDQALSPTQQQLFESIQLQKADALKELYQFRPEKPIGTNAYQFEKVTASELVLTRYQKSWHPHASVPKVRILRGSTNDVIWAYTLGGDLDASHSATPQDVAEQILKLNPKVRFLQQPDYMGFGYALNRHLAPLDNATVRQALAHLLQQDTQRQIASYYSLTSDTYHLPLMSQYATDWIDEDFKKALQPYPFSTAQAETLLKSAGYTRDTHQQWQTPEGTPLQIEIAAIAGYSDWVLASEAYAAELTRFGIPTQVRTYDAALYYQLLRQDKFQVAAAFGYDFKMFPHPGSTMDRYFSQNGMISKASGMPEIVKLANGQNAVLQRLVEKVINGTDTLSVKTDIGALLSLANRDLPFLNVYDKQLGIFVLEGERVKGWPLQKDPRWSLSAVSMDTVYAYLLSSGTLQPVEAAP
jgi:peptide/nickel transport system substrate-binding protein